MAGPGSGESYYVMQGYQDGVEKDTLIAFAGRHFASYETVNT